MDRREAMLRELNLYPLWQRRGQPASQAGNPSAADVELTSPVETAVDTVSSFAPVEAALSYSTGASKAEDRVVADSVASDERAAAVPVARGEQDREQRIGQLDWPQLKAMVHDCTACGLRAGCTQTVFGVGDERADWLFVGEGPGAEEDTLGDPFVGQAGKLLDNMLMSIRLKRGKNVYLANIVKCRPPDDRTPHVDEIATCLPYLKRQIALIQPRVIVALGKTAATALLNKDAMLGSLRGTLHDFGGIPLVVTYHPAYLLRSPMEKAKAWQDLCLAVQTMQKALG